MPAMYSYKGDKLFKCKECDEEINVQLWRHKRHHNVIKGILNGRMMKNGHFNCDACAGEDTESVYSPTAEKPCSHCKVTMTRNRYKCHNCWYAALDNEDDTYSIAVGGY